MIRLCLDPFCARSEGPHVAPGARVHEPDLVHAVIQPTARVRAPSRFPRRLVAAGFTLLAVCAAACSATRTTARDAVLSDAATEDAYSWPSLSLSVGGQLFAEVDTKMRVDSPSAGIGTEIDLEDDFDVDDQVFAGRIDAGWRFAKRHALDFSVFDLRRTGTRTIDREIQIGDETFPVNTSVKSEFETLVAKLAYRYGFLQRKRWHAGASFGLYWLDMQTQWTAGSIGVEEELQAKAPLPVFGLFGSYALTPKLYLTGVTEFFGLEYEQYEGFLNDTRLVLEHRTFDHLALGVGLDYFMIDATVESERDDLLEAEFEYDYLGLMFFARLY